MGKIGIVTFHESDNYGTCLQAYALQRLLSELGYDSEIINYKRPSIIDGNKSSTITKVISAIRAYGIGNLSKRSKVKAAQANAHCKFTEFRKERFLYSAEGYESFEKLRKADQYYDAFVVGSDMVWSCDRAQNLDIYFLKFADAKKRISFSPSFGSPYISDDQKEEYKQHLSGFDNLSCRESSGVELIKILTGKDAVLTVDPTLACKKTVWDDFVGVSQLPQKYILIYLFEGIPSWLDKKIEELSKKYNASAIEIPVEVKGWCRSINSLPGTIGPEEFVSLLKNAECVVTNSYHGLMFSLIFSRPFYVIQRANERWGQFEDRIVNILDKINCKGRFIEIGGTFNEITIDFDKVNAALVPMKTESVDYLNKALSSSTDKQL